MEINMGTDIHNLSTHIRGKGLATIFGEPSLHYGDSLPFLMLIKTSSGVLTQYQIMYFSMEVTISSVLSGLRSPNFTQEPLHPPSTHL